MICCYLDPGMALFLSQQPLPENHRADPLEWLALATSTILAVLALALIA